MPVFQDLPDLLLLEPHYLAQKFGPLGEGLSHTILRGLLYCVGVMYALDLLTVCAALKAHGTRYSFS